MGFFKDVKKTINKQKKMQKKFEKALGLQPEKKSKMVKEHEEKDYIKNYKLVNVNQELLSAFLKETAPFDECQDVEINLAGDRWEVSSEDHVLGYLPASANSYMESHYDDLFDIELDYDGLHLTFTY